MSAIQMAPITTRDGIAPFTGAKVTTPNPVYFTRMLKFVQIMQQNGLAACLNPYETGAGGTGQTDLNNVGAAACTTYGQYFANLFVGYVNVMWHFRQRFRREPDPMEIAQSLRLAKSYLRLRLPSTNDACVQALINGVKIAPNQLRGELCFAKALRECRHLMIRIVYQNVNGAIVYAEVLRTYNNSSVNFGGFGPGTNTTPPCPMVE
jgi:hypothetical protein